MKELQLNPAACSAKRLLAAWRVLIGVWSPGHWDIPVTALKNYTKFIPPPPNPWLDVNKPPKGAPPAEVKAAEDDQAAKRRRKVAPRHLVRHVLRARINAAQSLSKFLSEIKRSDGDVRASAHLATRFGASTGTGITFCNGTGAAGMTPGCSAASQFLPVDGPTGTRSAKEVIKYLKEHGAQIRNLDDVGEGDWAAEHLSSGDEGVEVSDSYIFVSICWHSRNSCFDRMKRKLLSKYNLFPLDRISCVAGSGLPHS